MSQSQLNAIIRLAWQNEGFRSQLLNNPTRVLPNYDLTPDERDRLLNLNEATLARLNKALPGEEGEGDEPINVEGLNDKEGEGDGPIDGEEESLAGEEGEGNGPIM